MPTPANLRRVVALAAALVVCVAAAATAGAPTARAADGRELLANAIATTRGSYLVYNFGAGAPAPMLNAGGGAYEMDSGGHLMIIKSASQRLAPRLLVDSHSGYQARCERDPRARTGEGLWQASEIYAPLQRGKRLASPRSRSMPTSSTYADRTAGRGSRPVAARHSALTSTTPAGRGASTRPSPAPSPMRASRGCRVGARTGRHCRR